MDKRLSIVTLATIFPSCKDPSHGVFIYQRTAHLALQPGVQLTVVVPVPYLPGWLKVKKWGKYEQAPVEKIGELTVLRPRYFHLPKVWMPLHGLFMFLGCISVLRKLQTQRSIDVIDSHFVYPEGFASVLLGKLLRCRVAVSARGTDINVYPTFALIRPLVCWTLKKADLVVAVSKALKENMTGLGIAESKIKVVPNGVDISRFQPEDRGEARRRLGMSEIGKLVISVGALIAGKGHDIVIGAIAELVRKIPNLQLCILGAGPVRQNLETLIRQLGLAERVRLVGRQRNEDLRYWFSAADVSCLASEREGWPNVITESLACGTPVVATKVGGIPEILYSEELGILTERSVAGFASGISTALQRDWDRAGIAAKVRERTWDVVASEIRGLLEFDGS
ncbi:MAG TPA: glycosyltransferase [Dongiaceae bacterium]|nr:glycosyltransferase [Dongiaceae bacterium]